MSYKFLQSKLKNRFFLSVAVIAIGYLLFTTNPRVLAQTATPTPTTTTDSQKANELSNKIAELEKKLAETRSQANSLSAQIGAMDNQIKLTEARINYTKQQISELTLDIDSATKRVNNLENSLENVSKVLIKRIVATYQAGGVEPMHILLTSDDVSNLLARSNYLKLVQAHDKKLMYNAQQARNDYENQKNIFEDKKAKVEALGTQLEEYNAQLDKEKEDKQTLLTITKNNETTYQRQLQTARAEQAAISQIFSGGGNVVAVGPVNQGDVVGFVINGVSACSNGAHLHFETHEGGYQDPSRYLQHREVIWDNGPDQPFSFSGSLPFPLADPVRITQGYGMTYYARVLRYYNGGPHTGIDMYSSSSLAVRAVKSGTLYRGSIACGGGQLPFAKVEHDGGFQTLYLHIYP
jgi:peptidoglycan hydrolase CwlO-like protein